MEKDIIKEYTAEISTMLWINYTSLKIILKKRKGSTDKLFSKKKCFKNTSDIHSEFLKITNWK